MALVLRKVSGSAWMNAFRLRLHPGQHRFVSAIAAPALIALLKATVRGENCLPLAAYIDQRRMIGFLLLSQLLSSNECWLDHFFIDRRYQGRGYGREALAKAVELAFATSSCRSILLKVDHENDPAKHIYLRAGFQDTGVRSGRQLVYRLTTQAYHPRGEQDRE